MKWKDFLSKPYCSTIVILQENEPEDEYYGAVLYNEFVDTLAADVLYFCTAAQARVMKPLGNVSLIVLGDLSTSEISTGTGLRNVAVFDNRVDFVRCYNALIAELGLMRRMDERLQELASLIAEDAGLDCIANHIAETYGHIVTIVNNAQVMMAHSTVYPITIKDIQDDIKRGHIPADVMRKVKRVQPRLREKARPSPFLVMHLYGQFKHYMTPVLMGSVTAAYFSVYYQPDETVPEVMISYLERIASLLSIKMQRMDFYSVNKANFYTHLFSVLLGGSGSPRDDWVGQFGAYGYSLRENKYIVVAEIQDSLPSDALIDNLGKTLTNIFSNSIYLVQDGMIILFSSMSPDSPVTEEMIVSWEDFARVNNLKVGVSSMFRELPDVRPYLEQAKAAVLAGETYSPKNHLFMYDDYRLAVIASKLSSEPFPYSYCYQPLQKLLEYDLANHSQLTYTLYLHLCHLKDPSAAYSELFIHKNTFYFRIEKIRGIMGVNIYAPEVITQITLTFMILQHRKQLDWDLIPIAQKRRLEE